MTGVNTIANLKEREWRRWSSSAIRNNLFAGFSAHFIFQAKAVLLSVTVLLWLAAHPVFVNAALPITTAVNASADIISADPSAAARALQARHISLRPQMAASIFKRPLVLESSQSSDDIKGDVFAVLPQSFANVSDNLANAQVWCDILSLHLNTKYCRAAIDADQTKLQMNVGSKFDQPLADSYRLTFLWQVAAQQSDYLKIMMTADQGPLGTHNYRITFAAVPLAGGGTFFHLTYSYAYGLTSKIAMTAYLGTIGRDKVGFTVLGTNHGQPLLVGGMRGLIERNTMRYHLAIEAYLGAQDTPQSARFEKRLNDWFVAAERYPQQLHEMEKVAYLEIKRKERSRQQQANPSDPSEIRQPDSR